MNTSRASKNAEDFLSRCDYFQLGHLPTEASHPDTRNLSQLVNVNLVGAIANLKNVDVEALRKLEGYLPELKGLQTAIFDTLADGKRIFLCGCGATGRLSLSLEYLWRRHCREKQLSNLDSVIGFMAGGDVALVHSLEGFEDFPKYGEEHLRQLGFSDGDLLISSTEGGETPYVIGATEAAINISKRPAFFLFCNPAADLIQSVPRSAQVLRNSKINSICLDVGPMALSGSTRMQASTVLMLAIGICLFRISKEKYSEFLKEYSALDVSFLTRFIELEADTYKQNDKVLYTAEEFAITVFTDTTERAPTFSLPPISNQTNNSEDLSLAYLMIPSALNCRESWFKLLERTPRILNWPQRNSKTTMEYLEGFDFSEKVSQSREGRVPKSKHWQFQVERKGKNISWKFRDVEKAIDGSGIELFDHLLIKMLLNIHSTLLMGKLGRYKSNMMTFVSPTNGKLIDRATRYSIALAVQAKPDIKNQLDYKSVVRELFRQLEGLAPGESVVLKTVDALLNN
jgi:N-acetylmuramic acid 6-phosphate etherase